MSRPDCVLLKLPQDFLSRQLRRTNYLCPFSSPDLHLKILTPLVALREVDDEVFILWSWINYTINPTNKAQWKQSFLTPCQEDIQQAFTDWKTCLGYTFVACCVTFPFCDLLDGPCCLENLAFLPREIVGELSRDVCIISLAIVKCVLRVSLTQGAAVVPQLLFEGQSQMRVCSCFSSFQTWCEGMKGIRQLALNNPDEQRVLKWFVALIA